MTMGTVSASGVHRGQEQNPSEAGAGRRGGHAAGGGGLIVLLALVAFALNLRSPLTAIPPVINDIRADLGISPVAVSLLTSIPVLCFGLLTPIASLLIARAGIELAIFVTLGGLILGTVLRASGGMEMALAGTVVIGAALTVGNIVSLLIIARDFSRRTPAVTGIYTSALNVGTMLTSALTAPLATRFGWRSALIVWVLLAVLAGALWSLALLHHRRLAVRERASPAAASAAAKPGETFQPLPKSIGPVGRRPLVWLLAAAFAGHLFVYYGLTAWLPMYLMQADGMDATAAGVAASVFQILALLGSFGVPALAATRWLSRATLLIGIALAWFVTPLGFLLMPGQWFLWAIVGGIASGGGFTVIFMLIMEHSATLAENRKISALVQGLGYTLAAAGPFIVGSMRQISEGWAAGFLFLAGIASLMVLIGFGVSRLTRPGRGEDVCA